MTNHMSGFHGVPGGPVHPTGQRARRGEKVLRHPCGCASTDAAWLEWCEPARDEYVAHRARLRQPEKPQNQAVPGLEELLS